MIALYYADVDHDVDTIKEPACRHGTNGLNNKSRKRKEEEGKTRKRVEGKEKKERTRGGTIDVEGIEEREKQERASHGRGGNKGSTSRQKVEQ